MVRDEPLGLKEFRRYAFRTLLPGHNDTRANHLALSDSGYVAYIQPIQQQTTKKRDVCGLVVVPGTLRWGPAQSPYLSLFEHYTGDARSTKKSENSPLSPFEGSKYRGIKLEQEPPGWELSTMVTPEGPSLLLYSFYYNRSAGQPSVEVCWDSLIEASPCACY